MIHSLYYFQVPLDALEHFFGWISKHMCVYICVYIYACMYIFYILQVADSKYTTSC